MRHFWKGVLGEDGLDGISAETDPSSHIHFVYQGYLKILKERGIFIGYMPQKMILT
jgi:predicted enzyme involved in methoxymalonyl-ACP biosynthesis